MECEVSRLLPSQTVTPLAPGRGGARAGAAGGQDVWKRPVFTALLLFTGVTPVDTAKQMSDTVQLLKLGDACVFEAEGLDAQGLQNFVCGRLDGTVEPLTYKDIAAADGCGQVALHSAGRASQGRSGLRDCSRQCIRVTSTPRKNAWQRTRLESASPLSLPCAPQERAQCSRFPAAGTGNLDPPAGLQNAAGAERDRYARGSDAHRDSRSLPRCRGAHARTNTAGCARKAPGKATQ